MNHSQGQDKIFLGRETILIVDDNIDDYYILKRLIDSNFKTEYHNGQQNLLSEIDKIKPICILLDYNLGLQNGIQLLKEIKKIDYYRFLPIIMLTNEKRPDVIIECMKNNASDYFIKDRLNKEDSLQAINRAIKTAQLESKLKEEQERLQNIIIGTNAGTWEWNIQTGEIIINERWSEIIGYSYDEISPVTVEKATNLIHPDYVNLFRENLKMHFSGEKDHYTCEMQVLHKDGKKTWVLDRGKVTSYTQDGKPLWMYGIRQEITSRKLHEEEIERFNRKLQASTTALRKSNKDLEIAKERAEESDRLKSAFLANMSHEIRSPMNAILGFASILKEELPRKDIDHFTDIILNSGQHLLNLINSIIDISKIDAGKVIVNNEATDINELLDELYVFFEQELKVIRKSNLQLKVISPEPNLIIETDSLRLRQVLINLIGNAIKFTQKGKVEFGYEVNKGELVFFVKDTGIGISKDKFNVIFERFRQESENTERNFGGTGLGLSIAKACVELMGGNVWLESEVNKGTNFYFSIQYKRLEELDKPKFVGTAESFNLNHGDIHILVAEDEDSSYEYLERLLLRDNVKVSRAANGEQAVKMTLSDLSINLVLMDIRMPKLDGWEATKRIRVHRPNLPVIIQTGYAMFHDKEKSMEVGCNGYLSKPIKATDLLKMINQCFSSKV